MLSRLSSLNSFSKVCPLYREADCSDLFRELCESLWSIEETDFVGEAERELWDGPPSLSERMDIWRESSAREGVMDDSTASPSRLMLRESDWSEPCWDMASGMVICSLASPPRLWRSSSLMPQIRRVLSLDQVTKSQTAWVLRGRGVGLWGANGSQQHSTNTQKWMNKALNATALVETQVNKCSNYRTKSCTTEPIMTILIMLEILGRG